LRSVLPDVPLVMGGSAVRDLDHAVALGATWFAVSARDFAEQLARGGGPNVRSIQ
ncbi:MAG: hypothetical protein RJA49_2715, partial [Actinomycetota bacterium]